MKDMIDSVFTEIFYILKKDFQQINLYCNTDPLVYEFVRLICCNSQYDGKLCTKEDAEVGDELAHFCYDLGYNVNRYKDGNVSFIHNLNYFLTHYVYGTQLFTFFSDDFKEHCEIPETFWFCKDCFEDEEDEDIRKDSLLENMMIKAKENAIYQRKVKEYYDRKRLKYEHRISNAI